MKTLILTFSILLLAGLGLNGQDAAAYTGAGAVNSSSSTTNAAGISHSFILGELVVGGMESSNAAVQNGFHYPHFVITNVDNSPEYQWSIYPNPSTERIIVDLSTMPLQNLQLDLIGMDGKLISSMNSEGATKPELPVAHLHPGIYILSIRGENGQKLSTHKIEKLD